MTWKKKFNDLFIPNKYIKITDLTILLIPKSQPFTKSIKSIFLNYFMLKFDGWDEKLKLESESTVAATSHRYTMRAFSIICPHYKRHN